MSAAEARATEGPLALTDRVVLRRRVGNDFQDIGTVWAEVRPRIGRDGEPSHTVMLPFRRDFRKGDHIQFRGTDLEVVATKDFNGKHLFLWIVADVVKAWATRRKISRQHSEGE